MRTDWIERAPSPSGFRAWLCRRICGQQIEAAVQAETRKLWGEIASLHDMNARLIIERAALRASLRGKEGR